MKNIAADHIEISFNIQRRLDLAPYYRGFKVGRVVIDGTNNHVRHFVFHLIPAATIRQMALEMLTEQAGDMASFWRQSFVLSTGHLH